MKYQGKNNNITSIAQLSQRDRAAEWVSCGQKWKTIFYRQHIIFNHCDVSAILVGKWPFCIFEPPFGGFGGNVRCWF